MRRLAVFVLFMAATQASMCATLAALTTTPLGTPVVPEVKMM